jgi:glycosyltransferase involved in cell wall biosynthesis
MAIDATFGRQPPALPRTLAGATIMQMVPALRDTPQVRSTIAIARALVHVGGRAIVAGERGELIEGLKSFGGEWLPFAGATLNRTKLKIAAEELGRFVAAEGVHVIHAKTTGAAKTALMATQHLAIGLVTELPDLPRARMWLASFRFRALGRGDRVIAHSMDNAQPMIARHHIPRERISIIPRSIDLDAFNPSNVPPERVAQLRKTWGIPSGVRIALVPGRIAPGNGHLVLAQAARILHRNGMRGVTFVLAGDDRRHRGLVRQFWQVAHEQGVDALFRMVGHQTDMPAVYAASDIVVVPYTEAPVYGRALAEAQAMARPVVASTVGPLAENMLAPPRVPDDQRTGWQAAPGSPEQLAHGVSAAIGLEGASYRALAARARQFAESRFSPQHVAAATLDIYAALLESRE